MAKTPLKQQNSMNSTNSKNARTLQYCLAINEALHQEMDRDPSVLIIGQGVKSPWYVGNTALGLLEKFGTRRVIDTPVSENAMTGAAVGAAIVGMRPVLIHPRMDFMMYAMDPIINQAANWHYMNGGRGKVPVVIWGIVNRGGEQGAQHSQAIHGIFAHVPGLKVVMPATPSDAKGLMVSAIRDDNPVMYIDDRWLHNVKGSVPEEPYEIPIGKATRIRDGKDVTIASISYMSLLSLKAAEELSCRGIDVELLDMRSVKPFDKDLLLESVEKTGRLIVADVGWQSFGFAAELSAFVSEAAFGFLKSPVVRVALPDLPTPAARTLEEAYFPKVDNIVTAVHKVMGKS